MAPISKMLDSGEILAACENADARAAGAVVDRYTARLLALVRERIGAKLKRRLDAEDIVQSAYRSFFVHAAAGEYRADGSGDLWRLLAGITLNKLRGQVERHTAARRSVHREGGFDDGGAVEPSVGYVAVEEIAAAEHLHLALGQLTGMEQAALVARLAGRTNEEIAITLGKSARTVRRLLALAEANLKRALVEQRTGTNHPMESVSLRAAGSLARLKFQDYVLQRLVGAGGMGKVYRATERSKGRTVAIKSLHKARQRDPRSVERFLQEGEILARLNHPNIVGVHGLGQFPGGGFFLVLDYVDGSDLQTQMAGGRFEAPEAARIMLAVAKGVAHAHANGVVHGDLKPGNALIDRSGKAIVTDFGLAHLMHPGGAASGWRSSVGGTTGYLAPEVRRRGQRPTTVADVYALGAMAWALVSGEAPSDADSVTSLEPRMERYAMICRRCLAETPARRYANVEAFAEALKAAID